MNVENLEAGIRAFRLGKIDLALDIFSQIVRENPAEALPWLWLSRTINDREKQIFCLKRAILLDPHLVEAKVELEQLVIPDPAALDTKLLNVPLQSQKPTPSTPAPIHSDSGMDRWIALIAGILLGVILFGVPAFYFIQSGFFDRWIAVPTVGIANANTSPVPTSSRAPSATYTLTLTPTIRPTKTATATPGYKDRQATVSLIYNEAMLKMNREEYSSAVPLWDQIIQIVPEDSEAYFQRGFAYKEMTKHTRSLSEYMDYLTLSIADFDQADALGGSNSGLYINRGYAYWSLAGMTPFRVDNDPLFQTAYDNLMAGYSQGAPLNYLLDIAYMQILKGQPDEAIISLENSRKSLSENNPDVHSNLAVAYYMKADYPQAIKEIDIALQNGGDSTDRYRKALILYSMGQKQNSLDVISADLQAAPSFNGHRYFLRALIYSDFGQYDLAYQDLETGAGSTWTRFGLYDYVYGQLAIHEGDTETGLEMMRQGEAAMLRDFGPLLTRVQNEIKSLGADLYNPAPSSSFSATFIPTFEPRLTARPTFTSTPTPYGGLKLDPDSLTATSDALANKVPDDDYNAYVIDPVLNFGLSLKPSSEILLHFQPQRAINVEMVESLIFTLLSANASTDPTIQIGLFCPKGGGWRQIDQPQWGQNPTDYPDWYVTREGDVYISIRNWGEEPIFIDQLYMNMVLKTTDGILMEFGYEKPLPEVK